MKWLKTNWTKVICKGFIICVALFSFHLAFGSLAVFAVSNATSNPSVLIVVDTTSQGCTLTIHSKQYHCPAGTIWNTKIVSLSQARAMHEAYVQLPSGHLSAKDEQQLWPQIQRLKASKAQAIQSANVNYNMQPLSTPCGSDSGGVGVTWTATDWEGDSARVFSTIDYYVYTPDCSIVSLEISSVRLISGPDIIWDHDQYASWSEKWFCDLEACTLSPGENMYQYPNTDQSKGYTYETQILIINGEGESLSWCDIKVS